MACTIRRDGSNNNVRLGRLQLLKSLRAILSVQREGYHDENNTDVEDAIQAEFEQATKDKLNTLSPEERQKVFTVAVKTLAGAKVKQARRRSKPRRNL
jgi:hypothetical protein